MNQKNKTKIVHTASLPPIITDWIEKIENKNTPIHIKNNYLMMIENVAIATSEIVERHRR